MGPGIYEDMPNDVYRSKTDWVSISELGLFSRAPALYEYRILKGNKTPPSKAQREGTIVHEAILEPASFIENHGALPIGCDLRTKLGKDIKARLEAESPKKQFLPYEDHERYVACAELAYQRYGDVLALGQPEVSYFWIDDDTGMKCKARADMLFMTEKKILDLKTTQDVEGFSESVTKWKYHRQAAFYLDGISKVTGQKWTDWEWLAVSHEEPFLMTIYEAQKEDLDLGRYEYKRMLLELKKCQEKGVYPALPLRSGKCGVAGWYHMKVLEGNNKKGE